MTQATLAISWMMMKSQIWKMRMSMMRLSSGIATHRRRR
ncbi:hypothetical protein SCUP234_13448, partial [Seiridium cupressi]